MEDWVKEIEEKHLDGKQLLIIKTSIIHSDKCAYITFLRNTDARKGKVAGNFIASRIQAKHLLMYQPAHSFTVSLTLHCLNKLLCHRQISHVCSMR